MKVLISTILFGLLFGLIVGSYYNQEGICILLGAILGVLIAICIQLYSIQKVYLSKKVH